MRSIITTGRVLEGMSSRSGITGSAPRALWARGSGTGPGRSPGGPQGLLLPDLRLHFPHEALQQAVLRQARDDLPLLEDQAHAFPARDAEIGHAGLAGGPPAGGPHAGSGGGGPGEAGPGDRPVSAPGPCRSRGPTEPAARTPGARPATTSPR